MWFSIKFISRLYKIVQTVQTSVQTDAEVLDSFANFHGGCGNQVLFQRCILQVDSKIWQSALSSEFRKAEKRRVPLGENSASTPAGQ